MLRTQVGTQTHEPLVAGGREDVTEASAPHGLFLPPGLTAGPHVSNPTALERGPGTEFSAQQSVKAEKWVSSEPAHWRAGVPKMQGPGGGPEALSTGRATVQGEPWP